MTKRIKYKETKEKGIWKSTKTLTSDTTGASYYVVLNINEGNYKIINKNQQRCIATKKTKSSHPTVLKRCAKQTLEKLGVNFGDEIRMYKRKTWGNRYHTGGKIDTSEERDYSNLVDNIDSTSETSN